MITIDESQDEITLSTYTSNTFFYVGTGGLLTPTTAPTNGQILIGSTGAAPVVASITGSTGLSVTNGAGTIALANTGVTSIIAGGGMIVNQATGAVTITSLNGTCGIVAAAGTNQATATVLPYAYNIVTSGAGGGVVFPTPQLVGQFINIENRTGGTLYIYPNSGAQIESLGVNVSDSAGNGSCRNYVADSSTQWYHTTLVIGPGTGISFSQPVTGDPAIYYINNSGVLSLSGDSVIFNNSASTGAVSLTLANAPAGTVLANLTGSSATPTWTTLGSSAVTSFSAGTTGFTPSTATTGAITLAGTLNLANGGTSQTTAAAARGPNGLNIDERTTFSNANYNCVATDRYVAQIGTLTAPVTVTLPTAASVNAGQLLEIADESGTVNGTNYFTIAPNGTDNLNGANASKTFRTPYQRISLISNGSNGWYYDIVGIAEGGSGTGTIPSNGQLLIGGSGGYTLSTLTAGTAIGITNASGSITINNTGVTSLTGDGTVIGNSASTGAVTLTLKNATAKSLLGNGTGSAATPTYETSPVVSGTMTASEFISASTVPTIAIGAAAGTGATVPTHIGTANCGFFTLDVGTAPTTGVLITFTIPTAMPNYILAVFQPQNNNAAAAITRIVSNSTTTTFTLEVVTTALTASTAYSFNYIAMGY